MTTKERTRRIPIDVPEGVSKQIDIWRQTYGWKTVTMFALAFKLLRLHIWAYEHGHAIRIDNESEPITITELHGRDA